MTTQVLADLIRVRAPFLLSGPPGCAKTGRIIDAAEIAGFKVIVVRASLTDRLDWSGCVVPNLEEKITELLPLGMLKYLRETTDDVVLFLDDLGQAPEEVQNALMQLFDRSGLSPTVLVCGATNRPGDKAGVVRLSEPLRSRFASVFAIATADTIDNNATGPTYLGTWEDERNGWVTWAFDNGMPAEVIAWIRTAGLRKPDKEKNVQNPLYAWAPNADPSIRMPDFRSWEWVGKYWNNNLRSFTMISSIIGKQAAAEFLSYAELANELPTPDEVWMSPQTAPVPPNDKPSALYLIASILAGAARPEHADAVVTYLSRMPRVYGALLARDVYRKLGPKLASSRKWVEWFTKNEELFTVS